jgi:hypothetical protein
MIASSPILRKSQETEVVQVIPEVFAEGNPVELDDIELNRSSEIFDQSNLEDILEERDKGPFIPLPRDWKAQVMAKAKAHINRASSSTAFHV